MLKRIFFTITITINLITLKAQEDTILHIDQQAFSKSDIYVSVDQKPEFPGGKEGLLEFYKKSSSFSICEEEEKEFNSLYYQVVIDSTGRVGGFNILKGINKKLNFETEKIVGQMPEWQPGKLNGKPVKVLVTLSIKFKVSN